MYISPTYLETAVKVLDQIHPFWGTSFLAFKKLGLDIGNPKAIDIASQETLLLDAYYNPQPRSKFYYVPLRGIGKKDRWVSKNKYATSGLQSLRTQTFKNAFLHPREDEWAWHPKYLNHLRNYIEKKQRGILVPAFYLAVWLFRNRDWSDETKAEDIIEAFWEEFQISRDERRELFDISVSVTVQGGLFQGEPISADEMRAIIGLPKDVTEAEGTLTYLEIQGVGPAKSILFEPASRLNLITGDNGLGKTFLLECAWWALTGYWAGLPAYPRPDSKTREPKIAFQISGKTKGTQVVIRYDRRSQSWPPREKGQTIPGLLIYARVDGSFAIWDPAILEGNTNSKSDPLVFNREQIWDGYKKSINGLINDWTRWQNRPDQRPFQTLRRVLHRLSPSSQAQNDLGVLEPGAPVRIPNDSRDIPTIRHPYDEVPIVYVAAGARRIVTLAYLIVWTWEEHKVRSELQHKDPERRMVIILDEVEAHLHPRWQRVLLPALMNVQEDLASDLQVQLVVATHAPLVMASVEAVFDIDQDKLFHLALVTSKPSGAEVVLKEMDFVAHGQVNEWLTSDVFDMHHARSVEAERAIESAKALQSQEDPNSEDIQRVSDELVKYLPAYDEFWPRWLFFADKHGVEL